MGYELNKPIRKLAEQLIVPSIKIEQRATFSIGIFPDPNNIKKNDKFLCSRVFTHHLIICTIGNG
jgi:hypothetical protein